MSPPATQADIAYAIERVNAMQARLLEQAIAHAPPDLTIPAWGGCLFLGGVAVLLLTATKRLAESNPPPAITKWHLIYGACIGIVALMIPAMAGIVPATSAMRYAAGYVFMGASGFLFFSYLIGMPESVKERIEETKALVLVRDRLVEARQGLHEGGLPHGG